MGALMLRAIVALAVLLVPLVAHADDVDALHSAYVFWQRAPDPDALRCPFAENAYCPIPGVTITTTRASPCMSYDGTTWHTQPPNTACVGRWGLESFGSVTNYVTNSADFSQPTWTKGGSASVSPVDGGYRVSMPNVGSFIASPVQSVLAGETWTVSCYVRSTGATTGIVIHPFTLGTPGVSPCSVVATQDWTRAVCTNTASGNGSAAAIVYANNAGTSIDLQQCQLEKSPTPGPRHDCAGSPCTRAADVHTVSTAGWPVESITLRLQFTTGPAFPDAARAYGGIYHLLLDARSGAAGSLNIAIRADTGRFAVMGSDVGPALAWSPNTTYRITVHGVNTGSGTSNWTITRNAVAIATAQEVSMAIADHAPVATIGARHTGGGQANGSIRLLRVSQ